MSIINTGFHRGKFLWRLGVAWKLIIGRPIAYRLPNQVSVQGFRYVSGVEL